MKALAAVILAVLIPSASAAQAAGQPLPVNAAASRQGASQVGRYQIVNGANGAVFLIDTATGAIWSRCPCGAWHSEEFQAAHLQRSAATISDNAPPSSSGEKTANAAAQSPPSKSELPAPGSAAAAQGATIDKPNEKSAAQPKREGGNEPLTLVMREDSVRLTIIQRHSRAIPGSNERILVHLSDITNGHVKISVRTAEGAPLMEEEAAREGEVVSFDLGGTSVYLRVAELKDFLIGDDAAVIEVTLDRSVFAR